MKIYKSITLDMETGNVLAEDSYLYAGPLALCDGAGDPPAGDPPAGDPPAGDPPTTITLGDILPEDLRGDKLPGSLKDFAGVTIPGKDADDETVKGFHGKLASVLKSYADTKSMVGGMIKMPGKDAKPEEIAAFREKLGVPKDVSGYEITPPTFDDERVMFSEDTLKSFVEAAHAQGMTPGQVQATVDFQAEMLRGQITAMDEEAKVSMEALKKDFGDEYDALIEGAEVMVSTFFGEETQAKIAQLGLGNNAGFVRGLIEMHKATKEAGSPHGLKNEDRNEQSIAAMQDEIDKLMASKEYTGNDPATHKKVADLFAKKQKLQGSFKEAVSSSGPSR